MYRVGKRWAYVRWAGIGFIAIAAPLVAAQYRPAAPIAGAVAGVWIFLSRAYLVKVEARVVRMAAAVQEMFDQKLFGLPENRSLVNSVRQEDIASAIGAENLPAQIERERLTGWYVLDPRVPGGPAVALCQRANAIFTERLLSRHSQVWGVIVYVWLGLAILLGLLSSMPLATFLVGVLLPILPAMYSAWEVRDVARTGADDRAALAAEIEQRLSSSPEAALSPFELRGYQDQLYRIRRDGPLIPEYLYRKTRNENERVMIDAANEYSAMILRAQGGA